MVCFSGRDRMSGLDCVDDVVRASQQCVRGPSLLLTRLRAPLDHRIRLTNDPVSSHRTIARRDRSQLGIGARHAGVVAIFMSAALEWLILHARRSAHRKRKEPGAGGGNPRNA